MTEGTRAFCPHLGLAADRTLVRTGPDGGHRCYAQVPPGTPELAHQSAFCLTPGHPRCPLYRAPETSEQPVDAPSRGVPRTRWGTIALIAVPLILLAVVGFIYGRDLLGPPAAAQTRSAGTGTVTPPAVIAPATESVALATPAEGSATPKGQDTPNPQSATGTGQLASPTPLPGGRVLTIAPRAGEAGWWSSDKARGNLGDSFLYAGHYQNQVFVSAMRLDLQQVARGAPVEEARLYLTGLQADRFDPAAGGNWLVQLLPSSAIPDSANADFQTLLNAPAAVTLLPGLYPSDLARGQVNTLSLDEAGRNWLAKQIADGNTDVIVRIAGPSGGGDSLFAWDSGAGPATSGEPPRLVLSMRAAPATPPPLPTEAVIVATLTPTPANVLTAAADALAATTLARTTGTPTPLPYRIVTPMPAPANLATAQALGQEAGFLPIVIYTPTPANAATVTAVSRYATAVAMTTGTFTPVPKNAVTPVIVLPTSLPENVATAAAQVLAATAQAAKVGTSTPVPTGALIATVTPPRPMVFATNTPENRATVRALAAYATAVAITTGTFTPVPRDAVTPTSEPRATPLPLLVPATPKATVTPTATPPAQMPGQLAGKILFYSDREGSQPQLYALDPSNGQLAWVTQEWPYALARAREARSPDGRYSADVQTVTEVTQINPFTGAPAATQSTAVIFVRDNEYQRARELTLRDRFSYDPAWSPAGDEIAFVSNEGNDEIYTIKADGSELRRLTSNSWEWDKHPSWSPDGKQIVFWSNRQTGRRQLWIMNADGSNQRLLLPSAYNDWDPIWVK